MVRPADNLIALREGHSPRLLQKNTARADLFWPPRPDLARLDVALHCSKSAALWGTTTAFSFRAEIGRFRIGGGSASSGRDACP